MTKAVTKVENLALEAAMEAFPADTAPGPSAIDLDETVEAATVEDPGNDPVPAGEVAPPNDTQDVDFEVDFKLQGCTPLAEKEHDEQLAQSIRQYGCQAPLIFADIGGKLYLVDGFKRLAICQTLREPYSRAMIALPDFDAAVCWRISNELEHSRQTDDQRAIMAVTRYNVLSTIAKKERASKAGKGNAAAAPAAEQPQDSPLEAKGTREKVAEEARISVHKVRQALTIYKNAGLRTLVKDGKMKLREAVAAYEAKHGTKTAAKGDTTKTAKTPRNTPEPESVAAPFEDAAGYLAYRRSNKISPDSLQDPAVRARAKQVVLDLKAKADELDQLITAASTKVASPPANAA